MYFCYRISSPFLSLLFPPAPPDQVDNATVRSENLSLRRTRLTWDAPEDNNARITNYWITYCITIIDSTNDTCVGQTTISVRDPTVSMVEFTDINPLRRYRVTIQAENIAGRGPESQPYFFDSASNILHLDGDSVPPQRANMCKFHHGNCRIPYRDGCLSHTGVISGVYDGDAVGGPIVSDAGIVAFWCIPG